MLKKVLYPVLAIPSILLILEAGIRIAAPQPVAEIDFGDIYTERFSATLGRQVKALVPGMIRYRHNTEVRINSQGNRDHEYTIERNNGIKRIAIVGSSVSFGLNLELEETFGKQLEKILGETSSDAKYQVLLFGRPGFKAKETYACIVDRVLAYDPDLIIYSFVQNNYEDRSLQEYFSAAGNANRGQEEDTQQSAGSFLTRLRNSWQQISDRKPVQWVRSKLHLYLFTANSLARILREVSPREKARGQNIAPLDPDQPGFRKKVKNTESWITQMHEVCRQEQIKFAILMHPYEMQLSEQGAEKWRLQGLKVPDDVTEFKTRQLMQDYAGREGIYFIDIMAALRVDPEHGKDYFQDGDYGHYTALAHKVIAGQLSKAVKQILNDQ